MMPVNGYAEADFKDTEIGTIPADWDVLSLSRVVLKTAQRNPELKPDEEFKYIDVSSVSNETNAVTGYTLLQGHEAPSRARKIVHGGDTIFATVRPYLRNIAQIPNEIKDAICSTGFCVIRANSECANADYLFYAVLQDSFIEPVVGLQRGSSYPAVSDKDVLAQLIPVPPLSEQRRIAAVLNAIQEEIAAQDDLITEAREFKRSLMQRLFTYGAGAEPVETKETEIGEIPAHWQLVDLGSLFHIQLGKMLSPIAIQGKSPRPYLRNANVQWGHIAVNDLKEMDFTSAEMHKFRLLPNDLLVCEGGEIGRTAIWENQIDECYYQKAIHRLRPKQRDAVLPRFYLYYMMLIFSVRNLPIVAGANSTIAHLPVEKLEVVPTVLPPIAEQEMLAEQLLRADEKIAVEEDRKTALQDFFKTMLHQLMTGQLRLLSDEGLPL